MNSPTNHGLKIADTPGDDDEKSGDADKSAISADAIPENSTPSSTEGKAENKKSSGGGRRGGTEKLTPEEMDEEIERVKRLNGTPTLAKDTGREE